MSKKAKSLIELIITWSVVFIIIGLLAGYAAKTLRDTKEQALKNELKNIRLAVALYYILNKEYPEDIVSLLDERYNIIPGKGPALSGMFLRGSGYKKHRTIKDPFGNIYLYNSKTGMVQSQTKPYKDW
jgi:type II secretory pathway pseudopilin PulG